MIAAVCGMARGDSTMLECARRRKGARMASEGIHLHGWALTLGASSGFGEAVSLALARAGLNIFRVHLDRKATLANAERIAGQIPALGRQAVFLHLHAAAEEKRPQVARPMPKTPAERRQPRS